MYPEPMPQEPPRREPPERPASQAWSIRARRRGGKPEPQPAGLRLASLDVRVHVSDALDRPMVAMLLTEDFCWHSAVADWRARRPVPWHRAQRAAWRAERAVLDAKKSRIRELAAELGIVPS